MGLFDFLFGQKEVDPKQVPLQTPWALPVLMDWLFSNFTQKPDGGWELNPTASYPGNLNFDLNTTILPQVWDAWQKNQNSPQMQFLNDFLTGGGVPKTELPQEAKDAYKNLMQTGTQGGAPGQMMQDIANWGGVPGSNLEAIKAMLQYGAPANPVGQYMSNIAQFGIPSEAGRLVHNRAMGIPTAASNYLAGYMRK